MHRTLCGGALSREGIIVAEIQTFDKSEIPM
jgi:hypothetical protein